ncbi:MAG: NUDIX hydrolase [Acidimicrobiales bacterium]
MPVRASACRAATSQQLDAVTDRGPAYDYHGALVVVEVGENEIVMIHPPGAPAHAPASLPSDPCRPGERPEAAAVRIVRERTGLAVTVVREFVTFIQGATPTGTMCAHGYRARITGGKLVSDGPEGPAAAYSVDALPAIVPIRVANQRTLAAYLRSRIRDGAAPPGATAGSAPPRSRI